VVLVVLVEPVGLAIRATVPEPPPRAGGQARTAEVTATWRVAVAAVAAVAAGLALAAG